MPWTTSYPIHHDRCHWSPYHTAVIRVHTCPRLLVSATVIDLKHPRCAYIGHPIPFHLLHARGANEIARKFAVNLEFKPYSMPLITSGVVIMSYK